MTTLQFSSYARPVSHAAIGPTGAVTPELVMNVDNATGTRTVTGPALSLVGPEAVASVDPGLFGRRYPAAGVTDAPDSALACVEVLAEDLPWRFTPGAAGPAPLPWLVLVVLEAARNPVREARPNPVVHAQVAELPDLAQSWAWAHVQAGDGATIARLLCPRRLAADTSYLAAVVPAFRGGVDAGLGRAPSADTSRAPAWSIADQGELDLPMYLSWRFGIGPAGDFRDLVVRLGPLADGVASGAFRLVDVSRPFPADPPVSDGPAIALQGALRPTGAEPVGTLSSADAARAGPAARRQRQRDGYRPRRARSPRPFTVAGRLDAVRSSRRRPPGTGSPSSISMRGGAWRPGVAPTTSGRIRKS